MAESPCHAPVELAASQLVPAPKVDKHLSRVRVFLTPSPAAAGERVSPALGLDDRKTELIALPFIGEGVGVVLRHRVSE